MVLYQQRVTMHTARLDPLTLRARSAARTAQRREQEWAAHAKDRRLRRWKRLEQYDKEFQLHEQQGLSPPLAPANSSSEEEEEEESDGGRATPREVEYSTPITTGRGGGRGPNARGERGGACRRVIGGGACGCCGSAGGRDEGTPEPSRKRKLGFSNLR
jgi:hypothetical protein